MTCTIPVNGWLDVDAALATLATHTIPGAEHLDCGEASLTRLLDIQGCTAQITVTLARDHLTLAGPADTGNCIADQVAGRVRRWFDTDTVLSRITDHLASDTVLAPLVAARPHLRVIGYPDAFEGAALTVIGQQVSLAAARTFAGRLTAAYGRAHPGGLTRFPTPEVLADLDAADLHAAVGLTRARAATLIGLAAAVAAGLDLTGNPDDARKRLLALSGIGPWTVEYLSLRVFADHDAFPASDLVLRRALGARTPAEIRAAGHRWAPYRGYATAHLWASELTSS